MRILIGQIGCENHIAIAEPGAVSQLHRPAADTPAQQMRVCRATAAASRCDGEGISAEAYSRMRETLLRQVAREKASLDGICLSLHGAAGAGVPHPEADLVAAVRQLTGPGMPIAACFDRHANLTGEMVDMLDWVVDAGMRPHHREAAVNDALALLARQLQGTVSPRLAWHAVPLLHPGHINQGAVGEIRQHLAVVAAEWGLSCISFFQGAPRAQLPAAASVVVTADGDRLLAEQVAEELSRYIWGRRRELVARSTAGDQAGASHFCALPTEAQAG